jgi:hypothetical protein
LGKKQFKKLSFQEPTLISATDNIQQALRYNNHFANLPAFEVRLSFGGSQCQLLSFFFVGSCCRFFQVTSDFPIYLDN